LRLQTQNLAVFLIGAFADVEKIFCWLWQCIHSFIFWRGLPACRQAGVRRGNGKSPQSREAGYFAQKIGIKIYFYT